MPGRRERRRADVCVLICSERQALAEGLVRLLNDASVATSHTTPDGLAEALRAEPATVLLLDAEPADETPPRVRTARRARPALQVLLLTAEPTSWCDTLVDEVGAIGSLTCHAGAVEFIEAVGRVAEGKPPAPASASRFPPRFSAPASLFEQLTRRELEVLRTLMLGGRSATLARRLGISPNTLQTHVQNIFLKLGVGNRFEAAAVARQAGLRPITDEELAEGAG